MTREPRYYGPLNEAHRQALEALDRYENSAQSRQSDGAHAQAREALDRYSDNLQTSRESDAASRSPETSIDRQAERDAAHEVTSRSAPDRPSDLPRSSPGWTEHEDMPSVFAAANKWHKVANEHAAAREALSRYENNKRGTQSPEQKMEVERNQNELDRQRDIER